MKLVYKGKFTSEEELPKKELPKNAVKFKEPESTDEMAKVTYFKVTPIVSLALAIFIGLNMVFRDFNINMKYSWIALLVYISSMFIHELLHAICFKKNDIVELYIIPKSLMLFVTCPEPISKRRYIFLSMFPNIIFGIIPLIIWTIFPNESYSYTVLLFAVISIVSGAGDYLNIYNAITQMPKGSIQQLNGFNSYWYMPKEK